MQPGINNTWPNRINTRLFIVSWQQWYWIDTPRTETLFADENGGVALHQTSQQCWWLAAVWYSIVILLQYAADLCLLGRCGRKIGWMDYSVLFSCVSIEAMDHSFIWDAIDLIFQLLYDPILRCGNIMLRLTFVAKQQSLATWTK